MLKKLFILLSALLSLGIVIKQSVVSGVPIFSNAWLVTTLVLFILFKKELDLSYSYHILWKAKGLYEDLEVRYDEVKKLYLEAKTGE